MTSDRKLSANRANASRSTGPRTPGGKGRSARNSTKHGLAISVSQDPDLDEEVKEFARKIAGGQESLFELAILVAEAQVEVLRVRRVRSELINEKIVDPSCLSFRETIKAIRVVNRMAKAILRESGISLADEQIAKEYMAREDEGMPQKQRVYFPTLRSNFRNSTVMSAALFRAGNLRSADSIRVEPERW